MVEVKDVASTFGIGGNDTLVGGAGSDNLQGGYGDDVLHAENDEAIAQWSSISPRGTVQIVRCIYLGSFVLGGVVFSNALLHGGAGDERFVIVENIATASSQGILKNLVNDFNPTMANKKIDLSQARSVTDNAQLRFI